MLGGVELKWPQLVLGRIGRQNQQTRRCTQKQVRLPARELRPAALALCQARANSTQKDTTTAHHGPTRHWAAVSNDNNTQLDANIDIAALRNAHLDTTRRAQTTAAIAKQQQSAHWIPKRKTASRAACLQRARQKMSGRAWGAIRLAGGEGRATSTSTWARWDGESGLRKSVYGEQH